MPSPPLSIVQSLSPRIAVLSTALVTDSCEANGCRGLEELLRPWEGGTERVSILSSTLTQTVHPTFPLRFVSWSSVFTNPNTLVPNPDVVVDLISSFVAARKPEDEQQYALTRSLILSSRPMTSHETFNHPVGVLFAVSTADEDPVAAMKKLQNTMAGASQSIPWMDGTQLLRFWVVVHDVARSGEDLEAAQEVLANIKKKRIPPPSPDISTHASIPLPRPFTPEEANPSALSQVYASALSSLTLSPMVATSSISDISIHNTNSSPSKPVRRKLYGAKLTAEDTQRLAALVRELVVQSLVPWMEARVREWNEVYQSNKRGITGRLFGAGRKLFGSSRPTTPAPNFINAGYNTVKGYYPVTTVEGLARRLADFAFMLRDYRYAASVYDSLRRDYAQDRAMRYAGAATEMYGLSLLLSHTYFLPTVPPQQPSTAFTNLQHTDISSWLEQAVVQYNSRLAPNQIQLDALRITILYYEAWKAIGEWRGVGNALVRAAGEAEEVPSAVMIEEAAAADTRGGKSTKGKRRRAFHLVLAASRYETAGLKSYSRRCLDRASAIYRSAPWTAAQDRIEYSLGRQAYTLGESDVAVEHFLRLLRKEDNGLPGSQAGLLEDLSLAYEQLVAHPELLKAAKDKLQLPSPVFEVDKTRVITSSSEASSSGTTEQWAALESRVLDKWDRKGKKPMSLLPPTNRVLASAGEQFEVELVARNPLNCPLKVTSIQLHLSDESITPPPIPEITLEAYERRILRIPITIPSPCTITVDDVQYMFHNFFPCTQSLWKKGRRLFGTKAERISPTYAEDTSLTIAVGEVRPRFSLELVGMPEEIYEGEEVEVGLRIRNDGAVQVEDLRLEINQSGMLRTLSDDTPHGDTGPSIPNAITLDHPIILRRESLAAGDSAEIPLRLTGTGAGSITLLGLATCTATASEVDIASSRFSTSIEILPLLQFDHFVRPGKEPAEFSVIVEVRNSSSGAVQLDGVRGVSEYWSDKSTASPIAPLALFPNQAYRLPRVVTAPPTPADLQQGHVVDALAKLVQNQPIDDLQPPSGTANLVGLDGFGTGPQSSYALTRSLQRLVSLRSNFPTLTDDQLHRIFPLFDPLDLDYVVSWSIPAPPDGRARHGQSVLHSVRVSPEFSIVDNLKRDVDAAIAAGGKRTRTMYEETGRIRRLLMDSVLDGVLAREDDPVVVHVQVERASRGKVEVDLATGPAALTIHFDIQNRSPLLPVRWMLSLPDDPSDRDPSSPSPASWTGVLSHRGTLAPLSSGRVTAAAFVDAACLVHLDGWTMAVEKGEEDGGEWKPIHSWTREGRGGIVEVVQAPS